MEVSYETTDDDLVAWSLTAYRGSPLFDRNLATTRIGAIVGSFFLGIFGAYGASEVPALDNASGVWASLGFGVILIVVLITWSLARAEINLLRASRKRVERLLAGDPHAGNPSRLVRLRLHAEGIDSVEGEVRSTVGWPAVTRVTDIPSHLFIEVGNVAALIVPKRALTATEVAQLETIVLERSGAPKCVPPFEIPGPKTRPKRT